jgi:cytochrome P450
VTNPVTVDLMDADLLSDPFEGYSRLRELSPMVQVAFGGQGSPLWLVTRYEDVRAVLGDRRFVSSPANVPGLGLKDVRATTVRNMGIPDEYAPYLLSTVLDADGEDHLRLRRLVARTFTPRRVQELLPRVRTLTAELLDRLPVRDGVVDFVQHFAYPLPITVICELVGIPEDDRGQWRTWGDALLRQDARDIAAAVAGIVDYTTELVGRRRADPADDLVTALIRAQDEDGSVLSGFELVTMVLSLVLAGHQTTANLIGNGLVALLDHPDQLERLRADPEGLMPGAVHELMRWCGPVQSTRFRFATEDVVIGGRILRKGSPVMASLVSANFDPRRFEDPHRFDITRQPDGRREAHVGFGHGLHYCVGAALARQEAEVAFTALLERFPELSLAVPRDRIERSRMPGVWHLGSLPVRLGPDRGGEQPPSRASGGL